MKIFTHKRGEAELDQAIAEAEAGPTGQMLQKLGRQIEPDTEFAQTLETRLQTLVAGRAAATRPTIRHWISSLAQPRRTFALTGAVLVLVLTLAGMVASARPKTVSATEILARAGMVGGWQSLHVKWTARAIYGPNQFTDAQNEGWLRTPNQYRLEDNMRTSTGENFGITMVSDGTATWLYNGQSNLVYLQDPESKLQRMFALSDLEAIRQIASQAGYTLRLLDSEEVAGRAAYVLDLLAAPGAQVKWAHVRLWVDQQYYLCLRQEVWDATGQLLDSGLYTLVEFDVPVNETLFTFTPPASVTILDTRQPPASAQERVALWQNVARQAGFPIFVPADTPDFGAIGRPHYDPIRRVVALPYSHAPGDVTMYVEQGEASALPFSGQGEAVAVGPFTGQYLMERYWITLGFEREGTRILLHGGRTSDDMKARIEQIAQSMMPAPGD